MRSPAIAGPNGIYIIMNRSAPLPVVDALISDQLSDHLIHSYHINTPIDVTILVNHRLYQLKTTNQSPICYSTRCLFSLKQYLLATHGIAICSWYIFVRLYP